MAQKPLPTGLFKFLDELFGKLRRFYLVKFRPKYVQQQLAKRKGECVRCGRCCSIAFRCPHLQEGNQCAIYGNRYEQCSLFPIEARDIKYLKDTCGFRFEEDEE